MLWIKVVQNSDVTFVCALFHRPPSPINDIVDLLDLVEKTVLRIHQDYPDSHIILPGDLNTLSDSELEIRTSMTSVVNQRVRPSIQWRQDRQVGHLAIVASTGVIKTTVGKARRVCTYRKHTSAQHAHFLASVLTPVHIVIHDNRRDPQEEYDRLYGSLMKMLDNHYPERNHHVR